MAHTTINKYGDHHSIKLYAGNSGSQSLTGFGFQPDMVWIKCRNGSASGEDHCLFDVVRGTTVRSSPNQSSANWTSATNITSFDSDGATLSSNSQINGSGNYVSWNWKAGGAASSNTDGQITSSVSANTTAGFSIVNFDLTSEGSVTKTVGHGLGGVPDLIITKAYGALGWRLWHKELATGGYLELNNANGEATSANFMNNETPTSTTFKVGDTADGTFWNNNNFMAYCFRSIPGYSKFGSYTGTGAANGPVIPLGFEPKMVIIKHIASNTYDWIMRDNKRDTSSPNEQHLRCNTADAENTAQDVDFLSNGFKIRVADDSINKDNDKFIYMAWGQTQVGTNNVSGTAV